MRYSASRGYVGGIAPSPEQRAASERFAEGGVRVSGGAAELIENAPNEHSPRPIGMEPPYLVGPFARGPIVMSVSVDEKDVRILRRRRSDGVELASSRFTTETGLAILSLERSALLIVDSDPDGTIASARLVDLSSGKRLARIRLVEPPETFVIANGYLIFTSSDTLHSIQIGAGAHPRTRALQPTRYTGSYPPSAR